MASSRQSRTPNFSKQIGQIMSNLRRETGELRREAKEACLQSAKLVVSRAEPRTPVGKTGDLAAGFVATAESRKAKAVGVAANTVWYGLIVHEDLEARHRTGEAKFLERPLLESERDILRIFARRLQV